MNYHDAFERVRAHLDSLTAPLQARVVAPLNEDWRFKACDAAAQGEEFDDSAWRVLDIPHDWSIEGGFSNKNPSSGSGGWVQTGVVWYRKRFELAEPTPGRKHFILFDGVSMNSSVWINGHFLGQRPYGFTPFWYDVTPWVRAGSNMLAVRADTSLAPYSRFYHGTGIYRPVWLISTDALHIEHWGVAAVTESVGPEDAVVSVSTKVRAGAYPQTVWHGFGTEPQQEVSRACKLVTSILDADGHEVARAEDEAIVANYSGHSFRQELIVPTPRLWSDGTPDMYRIVSRIVVDGAVIDDAVTPLGIRTLKWGADIGLAVNGTSVNLKGVCLHQDSGPWGGAVPMKAWVRKLITLKQLGCNAVRTAHHPFPQEFYHCCDAMGLYVMDETFDEWARGWDRDIIEGPIGKNGYGYSLYFEQWSDTDTRAMVRRDRNHPSVVMWSIGNEIPELYMPEGVDITKRLAAVCREEDASRPVTVGAEGQYRLELQDGVMAALDIAGYNYVNLRNPSYYDGIHAAHPDWVMVGSETFFDPGHIPALRGRSYVTGQFLWVGYDYLGEAFDPTETQDPATGAKRLQRGSIGLADTLDTPRAEYWYRQSLWAEEPVAHMAVKTSQWVREWWNRIPAECHWNWTLDEMKTVYCFTNCEEVELIVAGQSLGRRKKDLADPLPIEWDVEFRPGSIELVGYNGGQRACSHNMETVGKPAALALVSDSPALRADGMDAAHVEIAVVDEQGRVVPGAANRVRVQVSGAGSLLSACNGDMYDAEGYRNSSCLAVDGRCMAVVCASRQTGELTVTAKATGLKSAEISIPVSPAPLS